MENGCEIDFRRLRGMENDCQIAQTSTHYPGGRLGWCYTVSQYRRRNSPPTTSPRYRPERNHGCCQKGGGLGTCARSMLASRLARPVLFGSSRDAGSFLLHHASPSIDCFLRAWTKQNGSSCCCAIPWIRQMLPRRRGRVKLNFRVQLILILEERAGSTLMA